MSYIRTFDRATTAPALLSRWDHQPDSMEFIGESQNFVFRFRDRAGQVRYLRITNNEHRGLNNLNAELNYVEFLAENGLMVGRPVRSKSGERIESIETPDGAYNAVVFEEVPGERIVWGPDKENRKYLYERGKMLARLHDLSEKYFAVGPRRWEWFEDDLFTDPAKFLPVHETAARREYEELIQWLLKRPRTRQNYGMVHGDFGTFNTLRQPDGSLSIFDFDDCSFHWFLYDIAVSLRSARTLPDHYRKAYTKVVLDGYTSVRSLQGEGVVELSKFCRLSALYRFVSTIRRNLGEAQMDPQQKAILDERRGVLENPPAWF